MDREIPFEVTSTFGGCDAYIVNAHEIFPSKK